MPSVKEDDGDARARERVKGKETFGKSGKECDREGISPLGRVFSESATSSLVDLNCKNTCSCESCKGLEKRRGPNHDKALRSPGILPGMAEALRVVALS